MGWVRLSRSFGGRGRQQAESRHLCEAFYCKSTSNIHPMWNDTWVVPRVPLTKRARSRTLQKSAFQTDESCFFALSSVAITMPAQALSVGDKPFGKLTIYSTSIINVPSIPMIKKKQKNRFIAFSVAFLLTIRYIHLTNPYTTKGRIKDKTRIFTLSFPSPKIKVNTHGMTKTTTSIIKIKFLLCVSLFNRCSSFLSPTKGARSRTLQEIRTSRPKPKLPPYPRHSPKAKQTSAS